MLETLRAALALPDLRNRLLFVFAMLGVYVMATWIPVPGVDHKVMQDILKNNSLLGIIDIFSGGALQRFSIMAMGIMPYISAGIMFQVLAFGVPSIKALQKEGEFGRQKIARWTRYLTIALTMIQGTVLVKGFASQGAFTGSMKGFGMAQVVLSMAAGTCFLMWLGEQITERGIGNGVSFIIFAGIVVRLPKDILNTIGQVRDGNIGMINVIILTLALLGSIVAVIWVTQGERRIPVRYADRMAGRRVVRGQRSHLPLRVAQAGVIPIIFAVTITLFPAQLASWVIQAFGANVKWGPIPVSAWCVTIADVFQPGKHWLGALIYAGCVMGFSYFYTAVIFDPREIADNLRKYGGQIQGYAPGQPTALFINKVLSRVTFAGGFFLAFIALEAWYVPIWTGVDTFRLIGGTSLLIVVGVALETMQQLEQQLKLRQYEGLIK